MLRMIVIVYFFLEDSSKLFISIFIVHLFPSEPNQHFNYILIINQLDALISQIYFCYKTVHVLDSSSIHPDPARKLSANLYDIYHCCVYSEKLLIMDRGTVQNT